MCFYLLNHYPILAASRNPGTLQVCVKLKLSTQKSLMQVLLFHYCINYWTEHFWWALGSDLIMSFSKQRISSMSKRETKHLDDVETSDFSQGGQYDPWHTALTDNIIKAFGKTMVKVRNQGTVKIMRYACAFLCIKSQRAICPGAHIAKAFITWQSFLSCHGNLYYSKHLYESSVGAGLVFHIAILPTLALTSVYLPVCRELQPLWHLHKIIMH